MSEARDERYQAFLGMIGRRGQSIVSLAKQAKCGRAHLNLVILGERAGKKTWSSLMGVLMAEEYEIIRAFAKERREAIVADGGGKSEMTKLQEKCAMLQERSAGLLTQVNALAGILRRLSVSEMESSAYRAMAADAVRNLPATEEVVDSSFAVDVAESTTPEQKT